MRRANLTVPEKLKMQREGYKFFCVYHESDRCAIGNDIGFTCFHASKHKTREGCQYWKPVHIKREDEITRLRADLAAVTAERDRMREALSYYAEEDYNGYNGSGACARAAIEGVKEPEQSEGGK